jgi:hypothetical protein
MAARTALDPSRFHICISGVWDRVLWMEQEKNEALIILCFEGR